MQDVYVISAIRTPIGKFGGALVNTSPVDLAAHSMKAALEKAGLPADKLGFYIYGNILKHGHGQLLPRNAALRAGIPSHVDGYALDMLCSSGMMSFMNGVNMIRLGDVDTVLVGGVESMSQAGFHLSHKARWGYKYLSGGGEQVIDELAHDGLTDSTNGRSMGDETDQLAKERGVAREQVDEVAYLSHTRAAAATEKGYFKKEIAPMELKSRKGTVVMDTDEGIRPETTLETLAKLRPVFNADGVITAGNASQISDGACGLVLASAKAVKEFGLKPIAKFRGAEWIGVESYKFVEAPVPAIQKMLGKLEMKPNDIDLYENNEAFGLNNVLLSRELGVSYDKINVYGGAIALGHPLGCSGARIIVTLLNALNENDGKYGIASLCHGVGGGTAVTVERV